MKLLPAVLFVLPFSCLARPQQKPLLQPIPNLATLLDTTDDLSILNLLFQYNATVLAPLAAANDVTFLAPSDEAFRKLLEGDHARNGDKHSALANETIALYTSLLAYHTIRGHYNSTELFSSSPRMLQTFLDDRRFLARSGTGNGEVRAGEERIYGGVGEGTLLRQGDIPLRNGHMHIVNSFLRLPISVTETAQELGGKDFVTLLNVPGLGEAIDAIPDTTVFIPQKVAVTAKMTVGELISVLRYHVVPSAVLFSEDIREVSEIVTDHGEKLQVTVRKGEVFINDAKIVRSDVITKTGVVHVLDKMLHPRGRPNIEPSRRLCSKSNNNNCNVDGSSRGVPPTSNISSLMAAAGSWFARRV